MEETNVDNIPKRKRTEVWYKMIFCHLINMCTWNPRVLHQNLGGKNGCFPVQREPRWKHHCLTKSSIELPAFHIMVAHIQYQANPYGICGGERNGVFSKNFSFPLSVSLHRCSILNHSPTIHAIVSLQLRALLNTFKKINQDWQMLTVMHDRKMKDTQKERKIITAGTETFQYMFQPHE